MSTDRTFFFVSDGRSAPEGEYLVQILGDRGLVQLSYRAEEWHPWGAPLWRDGRRPDLMGAEENSGHE